MENNLFEGWEDPTTTEDFFSVADGDTLEENKKPEEGEEVEEGEEEKVIVEEEENFFEDTEEEDDEEEGGDIVSDSELARMMRERGLLEDSEDEDEEDIDLEDKFENTVDERIREKLNGLPEDIQRAVEFGIKGGSLQEYMKTLESPSGGLTDDLDMEEESHQERVARAFLKEDGEDDEFIESQIEFLKDSGRLKTFSKRRYDKWKEEKDLEQQNLIERQKEARKISIAQARENKRKLSEILNKETDLGGISLNKKESGSIPDYILERSIQLDNGTSISEMQRDLFYEIPKNEKAMIQLAALLRSRNEDGTFNFDKISRTEETKVIKKIKQNVRRSKEELPASNRGGGNQNKTLADFFSNKPKN